MHKVMLVDDDYPVLELLSEVIPWEDLGLELMGTYENGLNAWEHIQEAMPDILITDIGMPKMNGLELITRVKARKANVRIAILSCHSEFQFAQQAMRLNVQDYLVKDTFEPKDLEKLFLQFKQSIQDEEQTNWQHSKLSHLADETKALRKEQWMKNFIQQPLINPQEWQSEARAYGVFTEGYMCMTAIGFMVDYKLAKKRFSSDQTLRFAINNVMEEVLKSQDMKGMHVGYGAKESLFLFAFKPGIQLNMYDVTAACLKSIQATLYQVLKLQMTFLIGECCISPTQLKFNLNELLQNETQRFYLQEGSIVKMKRVDHAQQDIFAFYDQASSELREVLIGKQPEAVSEAVDRWITLIHGQKFAPETVKDWMLKLLLDQKLKWQSLQFIRPSYSTDTLHREIIDLDTLFEMKRWLSGHLQTIVSLTGNRLTTGMRAEITKACQYVSMHLDRRISLEEVAEYCYLNASYFSRFFKKEVGESFIEYVTRMKMERAKELLTQTTHSCSKICELLGYDNQSYFIKTFKTYAGVTPVEYRG
ncbi:DNA-binding response regulator [Paenibacillus pectinilyticus]|uniref:DNA-binding response regulator n=1 Tax=Paenibacillus pectinilyticus TaxID=512399 RepID=A0A1C0ZT68_9BACL|nr:response regulator [Paenibacillus pectinilyticus]OCT11275.1 DNA-binding response regulator [Paenibacillus pectinilyticus]